MFPGPTVIYSTNHQKCYRSHVQSSQRRHEQAERFFDADLHLVPTAGFREETLGP